MDIIVQYWSPKNKTVVTDSGFRYLDTDSEVKREEVWKGSKEVIFYKFDKLNSSLRYCNGLHWTFKDEKYKQEYRNWYSSLSEQERFNLYYGNGVVD